MTAILASFVRVKTLADGTPRIELDLQCKLSDLANLGCSPGDQYGIARITSASAQEHVQQQAKEPIGSLAKWCVMRCKDEEFREFLSNEFNFSCPVDEKTAREIILRVCWIKSRRELDTDQDAKDVFDRAIRIPYTQWQG